MTDDIGRDCPFLRRDKNGVARVQWIREAGRKCDSLNHRFRDGKHVSVAEEEAEWMEKARSALGLETAEGLED